MAENIRDSASRVRQESDKIPKKPYEPPKVVSHHVMEVVAAACNAPVGKPDTLTCTQGSS